MVLAAACIALSVFSCVTPPDVTPGKALKLSDDKTVSFDGTSTSLIIEAKLDWTLDITTGAEWITPSLRSGTAGKTTTVNFILTQNTGETRRKGTVAITAEGEVEPYIFTITQNPKNVLSAVNQWIYDELCTWYYWNDAMKNTAPPAGSLAWDEFFNKTIESLPWRSVQDTSNGENPATIDGQWNATLDGREHIYSYIERSPAPATRAAYVSTEITFGFEVQPFFMGDTPRLTFLVLWVQPDSPAGKAGLKRGMWITRYNGADIYLSDWERFAELLYHPAEGSSMSVTLEDGRQYTVGAASTRINPVLHHDVLTSGRGRKVAYLVYNVFESGKGNEFDDELRDVFAGFRSEGAQELVLDLRYNTGGLVYSSQLLTSLIANGGTDRAFAKLLRNNDVARSAQPRVQNPEVLKFRDESKNGLGMRKVYILGTRSTASASELVINALKGIDVTVVLIGDRTGGKNVGMDYLAATVDGFLYEMWPITFKSLNAKDFCDYANGFEPDFRINEFREAVKTNGVFHQLGDANELLLKAALTHIDGGTPVTDTRTRAGEWETRTQGPDTEARPLSVPANPRRGGMRYIPDSTAGISEDNNDPK